MTKGGLRDPQQRSMTLEEVISVMEKAEKKG